MWASRCFDLGFVEVVVTGHTMSTVYCAVPLLRPLRDYFVMRSTKWHGVLLSAATLGMTPECGVRTGTLESCAIVMRRGVCARFPAALCAAIHSRLPMAPLPLSALPERVSRAGVTFARGTR